MTTVFIISAPSGAENRRWLAGCSASDTELAFSVSYTTRSPRGNEKPGESYMYISRRNFWIGNRPRRISGARRGIWELLRHAPEVLEQAQSEGKDLILDIDVQGARQLKRANS